MNTKKKLADNLGSIIGLILSCCFILTSIYLTIITIKQNLPVEKAIQYVLVLLTMLFSTLLIERIILFAVNKDSNTALINYFDDVVKYFDDVVKKVEEIMACSEQNDKIVLFNEQERFINFCNNANTIFLVGLTKVGSVTDTADFMIRKIRNGTKIRALVMDPHDDQLIKYVADSTNHSFDRLKIDTQQSQETVKYIHAALTDEEKENFDVRVYNSMPAVGLLYKKEFDKEEMIVYFYVYKTDPGERISVKYTSQYNPEKISYFLSHYELLWENSKKANKLLHGSAKSSAP